MLTENEENAFLNYGGMAIGYRIGELIADAMKKRGKDFTLLEHCYNFHSRTFTT